MAHFAKLDENNLVTEVLVVDNKDILDENGVEQESIGIQFLKNLFGQDTVWVQTSYNRKFRGLFAGIGSTYDSERDIFVPQKPFNSWTFNYETLEFEGPVDPPEDHKTKEYRWRESDTSWVEVPAKPEDYDTVGYIFNLETEEWERVE
jgi:hypothetical protein